MARTGCAANKIFFGGIVSLVYGAEMTIQSASAVKLFSTQMAKVRFRCPDCLLVISLVCLHVPSECKPYSSAESADIALEFIRVLKVHVRLEISAASKLLAADRTIFYLGRV